jgi:hypothetical protein
MSGIIKLVAKREVKRQKHKQTAIKTATSADKLLIFQNNSEQSTTRFKSFGIRPLVLSKWRV